MASWPACLTGPKASPLGLLVTKVVTPALPIEGRLMPGPPKRFAQGIGVAFSSTALVLSGQDEDAVAKMGSPHTKGTQRRKKGHELEQPMSFQTIDGW